MLFTFLGKKYCQVCLIDKNDQAGFVCAITRMLTA